MSETAVSEPDQADDLPELDYNDIVHRIEISSIMPLEIRARRRDGGFDDLEPPADDPADEPQTEIPEMQVFVQDQAERLLVRARAEGLLSRVEYTVDVAVVYQKSEPFKLSAAAHQDMVDLLAMPNLYPYMRQTIHDVTARVGQALTLGIARFGRGSVVPMPPDAEGDDLEV